MENIGGLNGIEVRGKLDKISMGFEHLGMRYFFLKMVNYGYMKNYLHEGKCTGRL